MTLILQPSLYVVYVSTVLPAGGADTPIVISPITSVQAVAMVSGPSDTNLKFGNASQSAVPIAVSDAPRNFMDIPALNASSSAGGTLILEVHGR